MLVVRNFGSVIGGFTIGWLGLLASSKTKANESERQAEQ
jgi:hypothetical protein